MQGRTKRLFVRLILLLSITYTSNACNSDSHTATSDLNACTIFCNQKVENSDGQARVTPEIYDAKDDTKCCRCNYERITDSQAGDYDYDYESDTPSPTPTPTPTPEKEDAPDVPDLDPSTFVVPSQTEIKDAINPAFQPSVTGNDILNYAVLRIEGITALPLSDQMLEAFVYAFNNVTGKPWQYKGAEVCWYFIWLTSFPFIHF